GTGSYSGSTRRRAGRPAFLELVAEAQSHRLRPRRAKSLLRIRVLRVAAVGGSVVPEFVEQVFDIEARAPHIGPIADCQVGLVDADVCVIELLVDCSVDAAIVLPGPCKVTKVFAIA